MALCARRGWHGIMHSLITEQRHSSPQGTAGAQSCPPRAPSQPRAAQLVHTAEVDGMQATSAKTNVAGVDGPGLEGGQFLAPCWRRQQEMREHWRRASPGSRMAFPSQSHVLRLGFVLYLSYQTDSSIYRHQRSPPQARLQACRKPALCRHNCTAWQQAQLCSLRELLFLQDFSRIQARTRVSCPMHPQPTSWRQFSGASEWVRQIAHAVDNRQLLLLLQ